MKQKIGGWEYYEDAVPYGKTWGLVSHCLYEDFYGVFVYEDTHPLGRAKGLVVEFPHNGSFAGLDRDDSLFMGVLLNVYGMVGHIPDFDEQLAHLRVTVDCIRQHDPTRADDLTEKWLTPPPTF